MNTQLQRPHDHRLITFYIAPPLHVVKVRWHNNIEVPHDLDGEQSQFYHCQSTTSTREGATCEWNECANVMIPSGVPKITVPSLWYKFQRPCEALCTVLKS